MPLHPTRRGVLGTLAASGFAFDDAFAQPLTPTPQCHDGDEPTIRQSEGPYFKPSSPLRADLVEPNSKARRVELSGQVLTRSCQPVPLVDYLAGKLPEETIVNFASLGERGSICKANIAGNRTILLSFG